MEFIRSYLSVVSRIIDMDPPEVNNNNNNNVTTEVLTKEAIKGVEGEDVNLVHRIVNNATNFLFLRNPAAAVYVSFNVV